MRVFNKKELAARLSETASGIMWHPSMSHRDALCGITSGSLVQVEQEGSTFLATIRLTMLDPLVGELTSVGVADTPEDALIRANVEMQQKLQKGAKLLNGYTDHLAALYPLPKLTTNHTKETRHADADK